MRSRVTFYFCLLNIFFNSCSQLQQTNQKTKEQIDSVYNSSTTLYFSKDSIDLAINAVTKIYKATEQPTIWDDMNYYLTLAQVSGRKKGDFQKALKFLDTLLSIVEIKNFNKLSNKDYSSIYIEKAHAYFELSDFDKAIENYVKAENILSKESNGCEKESIIHAIAHVLYKQKLFKQALEYFKKEYSLIVKCKFERNDFDPSNEQQVLNNIGLTFFKLQKIDSAEKYYNKAIEVIKKNKYKFRNQKSESELVYHTCLGVVLGNLAKTYITNKKYDSAIIFFKEAIHNNTQLGIEKNDAQICRLQLADLYLKLDSISKMKICLDDFKNENVVLKLNELDTEWLRLMSLYYNRINNNNAELYLYKKYINNRDSLNSANKISQITSITKELENKQQKLEINLLQKDNQVSKLYLWFTALGLIMVAIIAFTIFNNYKKSKKNLEVLTHLNNEILEQQKITETAIEQLHISNRDKDRILNVVAHDLRNPIGAIANFLEIIQLKFKHPKQEENILQNSQQAAQRSLHLINDLLEVNKMQSGQLFLNKQKVDFVELINQSIHQVNYKTIAKQQRIQFHSTIKKLLIELDEEKMQRVIENLLDNAIKFSYLNGVIHVELQAESSKTILLIKDNGMGIPENLIKQIFTESIISKRKGTNNEPSNGLGLSICKQIVEAHSGNIFVQSIEREETVFTIELPFTV